MKTKRTLLISLALTALSTITWELSTSARQGSLTPPGAPGPTMKTLVEVEPRIAINAVNTPGDVGSLFKITQPGSYYLTGNITGVSGKHGIEIAAAANGPGVTIDLMGFELVGVTGSMDGISATNAAARNIAIGNGTVRAWGGDGIDMLNSQNNRLTDLRAQGNGGMGILTGLDSSITGCTANFNAKDGIRAFEGCTLSSCTATYNIGDGIAAFISCTVTNCTTSYNGGRGIAAQESASVTGSSAQSNGGIGISVSGGSTVTHCSARLNSGAGIAAGSGGTVTGCATDVNTGNGIAANVYSTVTGCSASNNTLNGIEVSAAGTVTGCTCAANAVDGIRVGGRSRVTDNTCVENGTGGFFSGIFAQENNTRIEGNVVIGNDAGISATGDGHLVIRNFAGRNSINYNLPASGTFIGTIVGNSAGMNNAPNANVNISAP